MGFYDPLNLAEAEFWGQSNEATIGFLRHAEIKHGRVAVSFTRYLRAGLFFLRSFDRSFLLVAPRYYRFLMLRYLHVNSYSLASQMFAFVGYIVHANGIKFPWAMQMDGTPFPDANGNPPALWDAVSDDAKWQIFSLIAFLEFWSELSTPNHVHYMRGGKPGSYPDFTSGPDGIPHPVPFNLYDPFRFSKNMSAEKKESRLRAEINNGRAAQLGIFGFLSAQCAEGSVPLLTGVVPHYDGEPMAPFVTNYLGEAFGL